jgi:hypothetical protein
MVRVGAEDRRQVETSIDGTLYRARRGYFEMPDHHAKAHLRSGNLPTPAIGGPAPRGTGYKCTGCGRSVYFTTCGNCGSDCVRES